MAPIETMTNEQVRSVKSNLLTEHFRWSPETFAKQGMDLANLVMYEATKHVEDRLNAVAAERADEPGFSQDDIQRGIFRLETLLENAIDKHFDLFELYLYRNVFELQTDLVPHVVLNHQENLDESLRDADIAALEEYEAEVKMYEEQLGNARDLAVAQQWADLRVERARQRAELVGHLTSGSQSVSKQVEALSKSLPQAVKTVEALMDAPLPSSSSPNARTTEASDAPWGTTRSSFLAWAARAKIDALPRSTTDSTRAATAPISNQSQVKAGQALLKNLKQ